WLGPVFANYAVLGMQSDIDRKRIEWMGAHARQVRVLGNLKFDAVPPKRSLNPQLASFLGAWNPLWIAASTMPGEDEFILDAFSVVRKSSPDLKLLIAPRHIERANEIVNMAATRALKTARRSLLSESSDVMVLDTIGELAATFEFASVVF